MQCLTSESEQVKQHTQVVRISLKQYSHSSQQLKLTVFEPMNATVHTFKKMSQSTHTYSTWQVNQAHNSMHEPRMFWAICLSHPITSESFRIIIIKQNKPLTSLTILYSSSSVSLFALLVLLLFKIQEVERGKDNISNPFPANLLYQGNPKPSSAGINTTSQLGRMVWTYWLNGRTWAFLDHSNISTSTNFNHLLHKKYITNHTWIVPSSLHLVYIHNSSLG